MRIGTVLPSLLTDSDALCLTLLDLRLHESVSRILKKRHYARILHCQHPLAFLTNAETYS